MRVDEYLDGFVDDNRPLPTNTAKGRRDQNNYSNFSEGIGAFLLIVGIFSS